MTNIILSKSIARSSTFSAIWLDLLANLLNCGDKVTPRGQPTKEFLHRSFEIDMRRPVLVVPSRKLSYRFMAAEAFWILSGDDRVETISPYNRHIAQFSDDDKTFFGAYGPKILSQMDYVVNSLLRDPSTRQAGLTIWRENPPPTKDVPCTVSIFFSIRHGKLNCHVYMRSSDAWLGLPYDVFTFSMLGHYICGLLNENAQYLAHSTVVTPGQLYLTTVSSHLYERNFEQAKDVLKNYLWDSDQGVELGETLDTSLTPNYTYMNTNYLMNLLLKLRTRVSDGDDAMNRWWEQ